MGFFSDFGPRLDFKPTKKGDPVPELPGFIKEGIKIYDEAKSFSQQNVPKPMPPLYDPNSTYKGPFRPEMDSVPQTGGPLKMNISPPVATEYKPNTVDLPHPSTTQFQKNIENNNNSDNTLVYIGLATAAAALLLTILRK